jgi:ribonuclease VapC
VIVLDASAIVAILVDEGDGDALLQKLADSEAGSGKRFASSVTIWEAACAIARIDHVSRPRALTIVQKFLAAAGVEPVAPDMAITALAVEAAERYGMGPGLPGILNLGDCFSYATAKHLDARLLFKGEDFGRTDIAAA